MWVDGQPVDAVSADRDVRPNGYLTPWCFTARLRDGRLVELLPGQYERAREEMLAEHLIHRGAMHERAFE